MWNYLWSEKYGSDQFSVLDSKKKTRDRLPVQSVTLSSDRRTVHLELPDLVACDQVLLKMRLLDGTGAEFSEEVYLTVHALPEQQK